jgi:hypothetical protein
MKLTLTPLNANIQNIHNIICMPLTISSPVMPHGITGLERVKGAQRNHGSKIAHLKTSKHCTGYNPSDKSKIHTTSTKF